jgi:hypothetical protein
MVQNLGDQHPVTGRRYQDLNGWGHHFGWFSVCRTTSVYWDSGSHETEWRSFVRWPWRPAGRGSCQQTRVELSRGFEPIGKGVAGMVDGSAAACWERGNRGFSLNKPI